MSQEGPEYRYTIEIYKRGDRKRLGVAAITVDWSPVLEWAGFTVTRRDAGRPIVLDDPEGTVEPVWDEAAGKPYVAALRAVVAGGGNRAAVFDVPVSFFASLAQHASAAFVEKGQLVAGETFQYKVCAHAVQKKPAADDGQCVRFRVEPLAKKLEMDERPLAEFLGRSTCCGQIDEQEMPVFIPSRVLEEAAELTDKARCVETGGILIGKLHRDGTRPEIFLEVTAQIPARHTEQEPARLAFTPETWTAADAAIALRGRGEIYLGWWHSHPVREWCKGCPPEKRAQCKPTGDFFSLHDVALHEAVFPRAYSVALVISDSETGGLAWQLFGWRYGQLGPRGFHLLGASPAAEVAAAVPWASRVSG